MSGILHCYGIQTNQSNHSMYLPEIVCDSAPLVYICGERGGRREEGGERGGRRGRRERKEKRREERREGGE